jgi:hypothetical protein
MCVDHVGDAEITKRSYNMEEYKQILGVLARRLHSEPKYWRQVYKSLLLLEYMAKNGPQRLVPELKSNGRVFTRLQKFEFIDEEGKDQGLNVRNRYATPNFYPNCSSVEHSRPCRCGRAHLVRHSPEVVHHCDDSQF